MISAIIPVLNSVRTLEACYRSVRTALDHCPTHRGQIVFIDNGSDDGSWDLLSIFRREGAVVLHAPGLTIAALRNLGAASSTGEILSFVDADCLLSPECYASALEVLRQTGADATGCYYSLPEDATHLERVWDALHRPAKDGPVPFINSGNLVVRRPAFEAIGGFRTELVTGEDADLGHRLRRAGFHLYQARQVSAVHLGNPRTLDAFFRKQYWQARGMFAAMSRNEVDKPLAALGLHAIGQALALVFLFRRWPAGLVLAAVASMVPAMLVAGYRYRAAGRVVAPFTALLLYWCYLWARLAAIPIALLDLRRARATAGPGGTPHP